jgi:hypothetical protein
MFFPPVRPDPWWLRLWQFLSPKKHFTSIKVPQCFHTHTKRKDLVKLMCETQPMSPVKEKE